MINTKTSTYTLTDITLNKYGIWSLEGDRRGDVISCLNGTLWITQEKDTRDYVIESGQKFWVTKPGTLIVQALANSRFSCNLNELPSHVENSKQPARI
jgi:hypothetical protein